MLDWKVTALFYIFTSPLELRILLGAPLGHLTGRTLKKGELSQVIE